MTQGRPAPASSVSIVIPAYNDALGLAGVLESLAGTAMPRLREIVVVDDGSTDGTEQVGASWQDRLPIRLIRHPVNRGYGAALKTGIRAASGDIAVTMDADGQHTPEDAMRLLDHLKGYDMVVGERARSSYRDSTRLPGKWALGRLANYLAGRRIPDLNCGLRVFRREVMLKYLHLLPDGFSASTTSTIALLKRGYAVSWIPITVRPRVGASSVRQIRDGFGTVLLMIRLIALFDPLRVFLPAGGVIFTGGMVSGVYYFFYGSYGGGVSVGSLLLLLTGMLLFFFGIVADQISALRLERYEK
jgi:glycosyltransferase involved in cell wall biosynthesis